MGSRPPGNLAAAHTALARAWRLSAAQAAGLVQHGKTFAVGRGTVVLQRGLVPAAAFALNAGTIKLTLRGADGEERILRVANAGESFGEAAAFLARPCPYDAYALTDAQLVAIPPSAVFSLLERDRRFARRLVVALAERYCDVLTEFGAATTQRGSQRLANYLEGLAKGAPGTVQLPVSKTVVAALLGMKKETLSRLLHQFAAEGIIEVARREITILDAQKLAAAAHR